MTLTRISISLTVTLLLTGFIMPAGDVHAQEDTTKVAYYTGQSVRRHPDGAVGTAAFNGAFQYALVTKPEGVPVVDVEKYQGGFNWVAHEYVNLMSRFMVIKEDSVRYELSGGLKIYFGNPVSTTRMTNPDGPAGVPALSLWAGMRYNELGVKNTKGIADFELLVPVSRLMSLMAGLRVYEAIEEADVQRGYGRLSLYTAAYSADSSYTNPDGPIGNVAIHLTGGGSSNGFFGDLTLAFPISSSLTWKLTIRGERVESPYRRSAIAGAAFCVYPYN